MSQKMKIYAEWHPPVIRKQNTWLSSPNWRTNGPSKMNNNKAIWLLTFWHGCLSARGGRDQWTVWHWACLAWIAAKSTLIRLLALKNPHFTICSKNNKKSIAVFKRIFRTNVCFVGFFQSELPAEQIASKYLPAWFFFMGFVFFLLL